MLLFPEGFSETFQAYQRKEKVKDIIFKWHDIDSKRFKAAKPFYYEDYLYYFEKLVTNKTFFYLEERDREQFNEWAIDTLVFDDIIAKNTAFKTFLSKIRYRFSPFISRS